MIADLGQIDLDIVRQPCAVNERGRIVADVFLNPFDVGLEVRSSYIVPPKRLKEIADPWRQKVGLWIQHTGDVSLLPGFSVNIRSLGNNVVRYHGLERIRIPIPDGFQYFIVSDAFDEFVYQIDISEIKDEFLFLPAIVGKAAKILRIGRTVLTRIDIVCIDTAFLAAEHPLFKVDDSAEINDTAFPNLAVNTIGFTGDFSVLIVAFVLNGEFH